ncbi:hypothetical protein AVEN_239497-1 [Araneus ventricosus]|uniref:Uncharacterized protein n=1 Tax=Araneus ventricosus TaxID=182803 RepID=A0A4Y2IJJ0_ARAVE|nr:hypothetical protein AVEN_239497-1 [Araneus ventricosus]
MSFEESLWSSVRSASCSFPVLCKGGVKVESMTCPSEMKTQEIISEDLASRMQNRHVAIKRAPAATKILHKDCSEMDYRMDVSRLTK